MDDDVMQAPVGAIYSKSRYLVEPKVALNVRKWEGQNAITALLIHGIADASFVWSDFALRITKYCTVFGVDLRGHGESDHDPSGQYNFDQQVEDISIILDRLSITRLVLIGHSMGADIAAKIAPKLGARLCALVLVDSGPGNDGETGIYLREQLRQGHKAYHRPEDYALWLRDRCPLARSTALERLARESLISSTDGRYGLRYDVAALNMITAQNDDSWWFPSLRSTSAPVLVVRGEASATFSRRTAEQLRAAAPRGELAIIPAAGHAVMNDNIEGFAQAVIPFIARVCSPAGLMPG